MNEKNKVIGKLMYFLMLLIMLISLSPLSVIASTADGYEVYLGTAGAILIGKYDTLADACAAVNNDNSGSNYTILVTADDTAMGTTATIDANKSVTLTSSTGSVHVITQDSNIRHITVNGYLILENITLDGNNAGGGIYVSDGTLEMNAGAIITKCYTAGTGGGVHLKNSTFIMNNGEISYNKSTAYAGSGGGVYMNHSTAYMHRGDIQNNSATWGGGVEVGIESTFNMNGGEIRYNSTTGEYGGGVHVYVHGTLVMNDGIISNNTALSGNSVGGGIFVGQGSHVSTEPEDWCKFIMNGGSIRDNEAYIGGGVVAEWNGQIEMNGGSISSNKAVAGGGVALTYSAHENDGVSFIMKGGEVTGNTASSHYGGGIWAYDSGSRYSVKVVIGDDTGTLTTMPLIYNNESNTMGGGIFLYGSNTYATIYDGKVYGNSAGSSGGGICVYAGSTLSLHGGTIGGENAEDANIASSSGGGIATLSGSNTFTMTGGEIIGNEARSSDSGGGGIYLANSNYSITGGKISNNNAINNGGGLYISSSAAVSDTISNTTIANNNATRFGGGAYIANTTNVQNLIFTHNTASSGGGVYVLSSGSIAVNGSTSFTNNSAANEGGGIYTENYTGFNGNIPGDYSGVQAGDYSNLTTNVDTVFNRNTASAAYEPPADADSVFTNIGYAASSIFRSGNYINPINNYDINYAEEPRITTITVTYDANGGNGGPHIDTIISGTDYTMLGLSETGISRDGYEFTGWNTAIDGNGTSFSVGDIFTVTSDMTLYAQWDEEPPETSESTEPTESTDIETPKTGDNGGIGLLLLVIFVTPVVLRPLSWKIRR